MPSMDRLMADARNNAIATRAAQERARVEGEREKRAATLAHRWQVIMVPGSPINPDGPAGSLALPWSELPDGVVALLSVLSWPDAPGDYRCWRCGSPIGLVPAGDALTEGNRWEPVGIVRRLDGQGAVVAEAPSAQCTRCCPDQVGSSWPAGVDGAWWGDLSDCSTSPDGARVVHVTAPGATTCRCQGVQPRLPPQVSGRW